MRYISAMTDALFFLGSHGVSAAEALAAVLGVAVVVLVAVLLRRGGQNDDMATLAVPGTNSSRQAHGTKRLVQWLRAPGPER